VRKLYCGLIVAAKLGESAIRVWRAGPFSWKLKPR
jgi:hypothetical protein